MFGLSALATRLIIIAAIVLLILALGIGYCSQRDKAQRAATQAEVASAQASVGQSSSDREADQRDREKANQTITEQNTANIQGADNANESAGDAGRRGQLAYCERQRVRGKPLPSYCA